MATSYGAAYEAIRNAYKQYVGREPESSSVVDQWLGGDYSQESIDRAIGNIQREPEAVAYRQSQSQAPPPGGGSTTNPPPWAPRAEARYDQWSGSGDVGREGSNFDNVEGFDAKNWNDPNMQTAKYQAGRIFGRFDPNDPNIGASILNDPEFKRLFPNAKLIGPDKIDFGDGRPVDFIRGHGSTGAKFSWQSDPTVTSASPGTGTVRPQAGNPVPTPIPPVPTGNPSAPPPTDAPMYTLPDPTAPPPEAMAASAARAPGDAPMSSLVPPPAQPGPMPMDDVMMSELAQQRAARLRGMRWNPQAVI